MIPIIIRKMIVNRIATDNFTIKIAKIKRYRNRPLYFPEN